MDGYVGLHTCPAELLMAFWLLNVSPAVWISIFLIVALLFNAIKIRRYGEIEFWLTVIKAFTVLVLIVLGILLPMGVSSTARLLGTDFRNFYAITIQCLATSTDECLKIYTGFCLCLCIFHD